VKLHSIVRFNVHFVSPTPRQHSSGRTDVWSRPQTARSRPPTILSFALVEAVHLGPALALLEVSEPCHVAQSVTMVASSTTYSVQQFTVLRHEFVNDVQPVLMSSVGPSASV
jgi:hypothetical protein